MKDRLKKVEKNMKARAGRVVEMQPAGEEDRRRANEYRDEEQPGWMILERPGSGDCEVLKRQP